MRIKGQQIFCQKSEPAKIQYKKMDLVKDGLYTNHAKIVYGSVMDLVKLA